MPGQASPSYLANKDSDVRTVLLAADISAGYAIGYDGNLATPGQAMRGITRQNGKTGDFVGCTTSNTASAIVGAGVTIGIDLAIGTGGKLVPAATGNYVVARAEMDGDADTFITIEIKPEAVKP